MSVVQNYLEIAELLERAQDVRDTPMAVLWELCLSCCRGSSQCDDRGGAKSVCRHPHCLLALAAQAPISEQERDYSSSQHRLTRRCNTAVGTSPRASTENKHYNAGTLLCSQFFVFCSALSYRCCSSACLTIANSALALSHDFYPLTFTTLKPALRANLRTLASMSSQSSNVFPW